MAYRLFQRHHDLQLAVDDTDGTLHLVSVDGAGTITQVQPLALGGGGGGLTFSRVSILTAGAGDVTLAAKVAAETQRLHGLFVTVSAAATVEIKDMDDGVLATWNWGANGGTNKQFNRDPDGAIQQTVVNKGLKIVNSAGNLGGYAIVSTG